MKDLNEKILKSFRDNIAISNLKEEVSMKKTIKKQVIALSMVGIVFLSGGFLTVNAATGGELINNIKKALLGKASQNIDVKEDSFEVENYEVDEDGNVTNATYTFEDEDGYTYKIQDIKE